MPKPRPYQLRRSTRTFTRLQVVSPPLLDLDSPRQLREDAPEAGTERPVVQIAQMRLKGGIDEPLIVFLRYAGAQRQADRRTGSLWRMRPGRTSVVDVR